MARGVNKVFLVGTLGRDPEIRYLANGDAVANFSVVTNEQWKDKQTGEKKESSEFHRCVAWRKLGEICGEYLKKGSQVFIEGKLQTRKWNKDGVDHYTTEIQVRDMQMLGGKPQQQQQPAQAQKPAADDDFQDDIPF